MESLTFAQSAALVGIPLEPDADQIVVQITETARLHKRLALVADRPIENLNDVYWTGGAFRLGTVSKSQGRTKTNLERIYVIPLDCDLADYIGTDKDTVYGMNQDEIDALIPAMVAEAYFVAQMVKLPIFAITCTGHGIQVIAQLTGPDTDQIGKIDAALKVLIKRMNEVSPKFVDQQAADAGTRLFRAPGTLNTKSVKFGQPARRVRVLETPGELLTVADLLDITKATQKTPVARLTPAHGKALPDGDSQMIVDTLTPHWTLGQKHAMSLAVSGMLAKSGVPEAQALSIVERLSAGDDKPWDRANSVATSYQRYRSGAEVRGYFALREFVPPEATDFVDGILDRFRQSNAPRIIAKERSKDPDEFVSSMRIEPMPSICFDWPWLDDYLALVAPASEAPDQFHLATALSLAGATFGRSVCTRYVSKSIYGNLYQMLVGSAGTSRKDTAIRFGVDLPFQKSSSGMMHTPTYNPMSDIGSAQGLIKELSEKPNTFLYITEYQRLSQQAHRQSTSTIIPTLTAAWDTPLELQNKTIGSSMQARLPYLSILAAVQPGILAEEMNAGDIQNGYATRWLYVPGIGKPDGLPNPPEIEEKVAYKLYARLLDITKTYNQGGTETRLYLSPDGEERWAEWYHADRKRGHAGEDEASMASRLALHIRKIAVIYAALTQANAITPEHLEPAIAYVEWCWKHTRQLMRTWGVGVFNQIEERIEIVLASRGPMRRRDLYHQCKNRKWSTKEFIQVFESMVKAGSVLVDATGMVELAS